MRLPDGWKRIAAGHYLHGETHTEIVNTWGGRKLSEWWVCIPLNRSAVIQEGAEGKSPVIHDCKTLTDAIAQAEEKVLPRTREILAKAWTEAIWDRTGTPEQWTEGQVADEVVYARHDAARLSGRRTGRDARPGDLFKHIELGTILAFDHIENGSVLYVREAFDANAYAVHPDDVVVIEGHKGWYSCNRSDLAEHEDHWEAETPECFTPMPDADLAGAALIPVRRGREYQAADGVKAYLSDDDTWWANGPSISGYGIDNICAGQKTLGATHRIINEWRRIRTAQIRIITAYHQLTGWRSVPVKLADIYTRIEDGFAAGDFTGADYETAVIRLWSSHGAELAAIEEGTITGRDTMAAVHPTTRPALHVITIKPRLLSAWSETHGECAEIGGRKIRWDHVGRMIYRDTDRVVDETIPTHLIINAVFDTATQIRHLEALAADATEWSRRELRQMVARMRTGRFVAREPMDGGYTSFEGAWHEAASLRRDFGGPTTGRTFEIARVTGTSTCVNCLHPVIHVDGVWRHLARHYPIACAAGRPQVAEPSPPPPVTAVLDSPAVADALAAWAAADTAHADASAAVLGANRSPSAWLIDRERRSALAVCRARLGYELAIGLAPGLRRIVTVETSPDDGATWRLTDFAACASRRSETETDQALRFAGERGLVDTSRPTRVRVYTDPAAIDPAGEWTNLTDPCPPGRHHTGHHPVRRGKPRSDRSAIELSRCGGCGHPLWRTAGAGAPDSAWTLEGEPLPPVTPRDFLLRMTALHTTLPTGIAWDPRETGTPTAETPGAGPAPARPGPTAVRFRVQTETPDGWRVVRTGTTPPQFAGTRAGLGVVADSVLTNVRQVLGLGPDRPLPKVRVQTWNPQTGLTYAVVKNS